ncbi:MAG: TA system VapC family ribonuclease toxin [Vicinamibacteria bacterium]
MRALFDVNALIALFDPAHVHHERAHSWWKQNKASGWASCPLTENGFVRILSQPKYPNAIPAHDAILRLSQSIARGGHAFWVDDVSLTDGRVFHGAPILGPKPITDLYLLALAVRNAGRLVTFDQGIPLAAVEGAGPKHRVVL